MSAPLSLANAVRRWVCRPAHDLGAAAVMALTVLDVIVIVAFAYACRGH